MSELTGQLDALRAHVAEEEVPEAPGTEDIISPFEFGLVVDPNPPPQPTIEDQVKEEMSLAADATAVPIAGAKGLARGFQGAFGTFGEAVRWAAERTTLAKAIHHPLAEQTFPLPYGTGTVIEYLIRKHGPEKAMRLPDRLQKFYAEKGAQWADWWEEQANKGWEAPSQDVMNAKWSERPFSKAAATIGEAAPSYLTAIAASLLTKNPHVGLVLLSTQAGAGAYGEQREAGAGVTKADTIALMTAAFEYVTEKIPFDEVLKPAKIWFLKAIKVGTAEALQEFIAGIGENFLAHFGFNAKDWQSIPAAAKEGVEHALDGWLENIVAGAGLGVLGAGAVGRRGIGAPEAVTEPPTMAEKAPVRPAEPPVMSKEAVTPQKPTEAKEVLPAKKPRAQKGKEAWEMTREEFRIKQMEKRAEHKTPAFSDAAKKAIPAYKDPKTKREVEKAWREVFAKYDTSHSNIVSAALSEGKPVPREVLEEYKSEKWAQEALKKLAVKEAPQSIREKAQKLANKTDKRVGVYLGKDNKFHLFSTLNPPKGVTSYESITPDIRPEAKLAPAKAEGEAAPSEPAVADFEETRHTLSKELKKVEKIRETEREPAVSELRKRQRTQATAIKKRLIKQGMPVEEATRRSKAGLRGEADVPEYTPPKLTEKQWRSLSQKATEVYPDPQHVFENRRAQDALDKLQKGQIVTDSDIMLLREILGQEVGDQLAETMRKIQNTPAKRAQRKWDILRDIIMFLKTPANYDIQFSRQAFSFFLRNPVMYTRGIGRNIAAYLSRDYAQGLIKATVENPRHKEARHYGMNFREVGIGAERTRRLEQFRGDLPYRMLKWGKYKGPVLYRISQPFRGWGRILLASERGAVASINAHLQGLWDKKAPGWDRMVQQAASKELPQNDRNALLDQIEKEKHAFAESMNVFMKVLAAKSASGKQIQAAANWVLWSPSFTVSRFLRPVRVLTSSGSRAYAASLVASNIGGAFLVGSLISLAANLFRDEDDQVEVELDPRSSNWGRFKLGDTWFDLGAGELQHYRFLARFITGEVKKQSGRTVEVPRWEAIKSLAETKETALIGVIHELATGHDIFGNPVFELPELEKLYEEGTMTADAYAKLIQKSEEIRGADKALVTGRYLSEKALPFFVGSFCEAAIMDGWPQAAAAGITEVFAFQASSYAGRAKAELEVMQDELARTAFGKDWRETSLREKIEMADDTPDFKEKMVQVHQQRLEREPYKAEYPTEKQEKVRKRMNKAMSAAISSELKSLGVEVGGVGRRILDFYLNETEFEQYITRAEREIAKSLNRYFASREYRGISSLADKREATIKKIKSAKGKALKDLKKEWGIL